MNNLLYLCKSHDSTCLYEHRKIETREPSATPDHTDGQPDTRRLPRGIRSGSDEASASSLVYQGLSYRTFVLIII